MPHLPARALAALFVLSAAAIVSPAWAQTRTTAIDEMNALYTAKPYEAERKLPEVPKPLCTQRQKTVVILLLHQIELDIKMERERGIGGAAAAALDSYAREVANLKSAVAFMPLADCPGGDPDRGEVSEGFAAPVVPARFCTAQEQRDFIKTLEPRIGLIQSQLAKQQSVLNDLLKRGAGDNHPEVLKVAKRITTKTAEAAVLQAAYDRARAMPISDCSDPPPEGTELVPGQPPGAEPPKDARTGMMPGDAFGLPASGFAIAFTGQARHTKLPVLAFLGREAPGAPAPTLGLVPAPDREWSAAWGVSGHYAFAPDAASGWDAGIRYSGYEWSGRGVFETLSLEGDRLAIAGVGVGAAPNGFALNYLGGLNTLRDGAAERTYEQAGGEFEIGWRDTGLSVSQRLALVFGYSREEHTADFAAEIPGFARAVGYRQTIDADYWSVGAVLQGEAVIDGPWRIGGTLKAAYREGDFAGSNTLSFTGFSDARMDDAAREGGFTRSVEVALSYEFDTNARISAVASYARADAVPVWETPGGGARAFIDTGSSESWAIGVRLGVGFGPPP